MKLRNLENKDAQRMLEWMKDEEVVGKLQASFFDMTLDDCKKFIKNSRNGNNMHMAIVNDDDIYVGTVSLKNITGKSAEFAIVISKAAMGKNIANKAMNEMLKLAFSELELTDVYWCVAEDNLRAIRFYDKNGYRRTNIDSIDVLGNYSTEQKKSYIWYLVKRNDFLF